MAAETPALPVHREFLAALERRDIAGRAQAYRRIGPRRGPAVVLLHGLMDNSAGFAPLLAALDDRGALDYDLIAPDWRGHGDSEPTPGAYWFPNYLADLEALLATLGVTEPVVLVGHSMGGQIASLYAGARPERVAGLVALDSLNVPDSDPQDSPARYRDWLDTLAHGAAEAERVYDSVAAFAARLARRYPELDDAALQYLAAAVARGPRKTGASACVSTRRICAACPTAFVPPRPVRCGARFAAPCCASTVAVRRPRRSSMPKRSRLAAPVLPTSNRSHSPTAGTCCTFRTRPPWPRNCMRFCDESDARI